MKQYSRSQVQEFADSLERMIHGVLPNAVTSSVVTPIALHGSGEVLIDVKMDGRLVELECSLDNLYGVTEVTELNGFMRGSDACFSSADEAVRYLSHLFATTDHDQALAQPLSGISSGPGL